MVVLHVLGHAVIRTAVGTITPRADTGFALAVYLIANRGRRFTRESLLRIFWREPRCRKAAHAFAEALYKLRRRGLPVLTDSAQHVWIPRDAATIDIDALAADPPCVLLERELTVLPGYVPPRSQPAFRDWLDEWRRTMEARVVSQMHDAMRRAERAEDWRTVLGLAEAILRNDRDSAEALRATARAAAELRAERLTGKHAPTVSRTRGRTRTTVAERAARSAWSLPQAGFAAARDTALVGRDGELQLLCEALDRAARGEGSGVFVWAGAGAGKSRLMREAMTESHLRGASVTYTSCQEYDLHRPLSAFVDAVPFLRQLPGAAGADPAFAPDLDRLTRIDASEPHKRRDAADAEYMFGRVRQALFDLVDAVCDERPLLLVIENVQWLDTASWALLHEMMTWATDHRLAIALTSRTQWDVATHGLPPSLLRMLALPALDFPASATHARDYADAIGQAPPSPLLDWCTSASEGNPYLLEELLNHWASTGEQFQTPPSLALLLDTRLTRLAPAALHVLQTCAVLGRNSTLERIERVLHDSELPLFAALEELGHAGMLRTVRDEDATGNGPVLCRHDALAQAAITRLSPAGRELLHRRAGAALEADLEGPDSAALLWDCAEHWYEAGNSVHAVQLGLSCVAQLIRIGMVQSAAEACERTLRYCVIASDREAVLRAYAEILHLNRQWADVPAVVAEIRALNGRTDERVHDDLEILVFKTGWQAHPDLESLLARTIECVTSVDADPVHRVQAGTLALKLGTNVGDIALMREIFRALREPLSSPLIPATDRTTVQMIYHTVAGDLQSGAACARDLLREADAAETSEAARLWRAVDCTVALRRSGHMEEAHAQYARIYERATSLGIARIAAEACLRSFTAYLDTGDVAQASTWIQRYMGLHSSAWGHTQTCTLRLALARVELAHGNYDAAEHLLVVGDRNLSTDATKWVRTSALAVTLRVAIARNDAEAVRRATESLDEVRELIETLGSHDFGVFSLYLGYRYLREDAKAMDLLEGYVTGGRRDRDPIADEVLRECAARAIVPTLMR